MRQLATRLGPTEDPEEGQGPNGGPTGGRSNEPRYPGQFLFAAEQDSGFHNARLCVAVLIVAVPTQFRFISGLTLRAGRAVSTDAETM